MQWPPVKFTALQFTKLRYSTIPCCTALLCVYLHLPAFISLYQPLSDFICFALLCINLMSSTLQKSLGQLSSLLASSAQRQAVGSSGALRRRGGEEEGRSH